MTESKKPALNIDQENDLRLQIQDMQQQLSELKAQNKIIWDLLVRLGSKLQLSSTSIKTAVSSLLDYDIFWDETTQHEFLQAIDNSTNELAELIILMILTFRSQAKTLEIETEPNMIQEILIKLQNNIIKNGHGIQISAQYPLDGKPVLVDYQYLSVALEMLIEVIFSEGKDAAQLSVLVREEEESWYLQINDLNPTIVTTIHHFFEQSNDMTMVMIRILPENALKLMTACRMLHLQNIKLYRQDTTENSTTLCLLIPTAPNYTLIE